MANKSADADALRQQLAEAQALLAIYEQLPLTDEQRRMLAGMVRFLFY